MLRKNKPLEDDFAVFHTLVGPNVTVEGRIKFSDGIRIDGHVVGDIEVEHEAAGSIAVGPGGEVRGNIIAHRVLVAGAVFGNIRALEMAHLLSTARITGDISYAKLSICPGAVINGALSELAEGEKGVEAPRKLVRLADKTHDNAGTSGSTG